MKVLIYVTHHVGGTVP